MTRPRVGIERCPRKLDVPWPVVAVVLVWGAIVLVRELTKASTAGPLCLFRRVTDLPCPTCGATRGVMSLLSGHPLQAFAFNPLVMVALVAGLVWLAMRVGLGRRVRLEATATQQRWLWAVAAVLFVINWAFVVMREGSAISH